MNREQFTALVTREQESLRRFLLALCTGNLDDANDIAQEALIKAYLARDKYCEQELPSRLTIGKNSSKVKTAFW